MGVEVIDRCNLMILHEPGYENLAQFLADNHVVITASLPCYLEENVEKQRGKGVYDGSITALQKLNALGYGRRQGLQLNLVYNPIDLNLPPAQSGLEADYRRILKKEYDIDFNQLSLLPICLSAVLAGCSWLRACMKNTWGFLKTIISTPTLKLSCAETRWCGLPGICL